MKEDMFETAQWTVREDSLSENRIAANGNKFLIGNGYMGYRGTLEEFGADRQTALNLAGFYDGVKGKWRETVNAPNPLYTELYADTERLSVFSETRKGHTMSLNIASAVFSSESVYAAGGGTVRVKTERFAHKKDYRRLLSKITLCADRDTEFVLYLGTDEEVWDINGPHLQDFREKTGANRICVSCTTQEQGIPLKVCTAFSEAPEGFEKRSGKILARFRLRLKKGEARSVNRFASVCFGLEAAEAEADCLEAASCGYEALKCSHEAEWREIWRINDIELVGDGHAQKALRYSIYHLLILRPVKSGSIAARGLSGQTYKGAVFWDTEIFLLPFFLANDPEAAKRLIEYRIAGLAAAKRKAAFYGYEGAFYAWESQDGEDACSDFNVVDVFTHRPVRTYFKDKQIHISGDAAYALGEYYRRTGDETILFSGGLEMVLECAWFFYSYSFYNHRKDRFELLDVIGPDEYHERVNNNAFTNYLASATAEIALELYRAVEKDDRAFAEETAARVGRDIIAKLKEWKEKLYLPQPDEKGVIEQFDGYFRLEDVGVEEVRSRLVKPNEYWGGSGGVATATRVIKQADVVALFHLFPDKFSAEIVKANYEFYLPYTEHGSSLSACMYALAAAATGDVDAAWQWFLKTAEIDLCGESKQWAGEVYIGGTHPAANGGAWMTAIEGFAGMRTGTNGTTFTPRFPANIERMNFRVLEKGTRRRIQVTRTGTETTEE